MNIVAVTDGKSVIVDPALLAAAESVHRQLRPHLGPDYLGRMRSVFASGAEMAVAVEGARVLGLTVFRVVEKTFSGRELYCDDLVTDDKQRSGGVGAALIEYMLRVCHERDCDTLALDSGTQRQQAHKFYFREGLTVNAFHFARKLK